VKVKWVKPDIENIKLIFTLAELLKLAVPMDTFN